MLTNKQYEGLAFDLLEAGAPYDDLLKLEREYLPANPALLPNLKLFVIALDFNQRLSKEQKGQSGPVIALIEKREKILAKDRLIEEQGFDIRNLFFFVAKARKPFPDFKNAIGVCCERTLGILEGLRDFEISKNEYDLFVSSFRDHPFGSRYLNEKEKTQVVEDIFERASWMQPPLQGYFLDNMLSDMEIQLGNVVELKLKFRHQFTERRKAFEGLVQEKEVQKQEEFTTSQQVLAVHFLLVYCKAPIVDLTHKARFIQALTGRNYKNIYDAVRSPLSTKIGNLRRKDLQVVRTFFENLGLLEIVKLINNELDKPDD